MSPLTLEDKYIKHFGVSSVEINRIINIDDTEFQIISNKIKGTTADKQVSLALLCCITNEFYGKPETEWKEIVDLCKQFACVDTNFAANLNKKIQFFMIKGVRGSQNKTIKLTVPGRDEGKSLIKSLL